MTVDDFRRSVLEAETPPPGLSPLLLALWYDGRNDWNRAHDLVAASDSRNAAWIHAYLHRREGDPGNAGYWYDRAGQPVALDDPMAEWSRIAKALPEP